MDYTDDDKVGLNQLNPNLQALLNNLTTSQAFQELKSSLDVHKSDNQRHLTEDTIDKINYSYNRIKETLDEDVGKMLNDFVNTVVGIQQHIENEVIHWTAVEKAEYKNILNLVRNAIFQMESNISKYQLDTSSNYVSNERYESLDTNVQQHIANSNIHVYGIERTKWNNMIHDANSYTDQTMQAHKQDTTTHTTDREKTIWNDHVNNNAIHMSVTDVALIRNHMEDNTIHIPLDDQVKLKELESLVPTLVNRITELEKIVSNQEALLERISRSISILE